MHVLSSVFQIKCSGLKCLILAAFLFPTILLSGCGRQSTPVSDTGFYFDTVITITLYEEDNKSLLDECMALAGHYEALLSPTVEGSDVWKINANPGTFITVDKDTLSLLQEALSYAEVSDGMVTPSIGALSSLWNFGSDCPQMVPESQAIQNALAHIDYHSIEIQGSRVRLNDPEAVIDLGFIAKGFIADKMKEFLLSKGVTSALINLGGNLVAVGSKPDGTPFKIGIQKPFASSGTAALTLDLTDISVVSSGNYERYFEKDGRLYHHILSAETGYPVENELSQVTILSPDSTQADALSTLCFILGYEKAVRLLENYPDVQAVFITEDGQILYYHF
ncbi:MAG: FAD:protein FMN transferase [Lachnospiraceae bacterium]|nr:FAD:protein FMN transferase [Lachnospiraceae bacterium]